MIEQQSQPLPSIAIIIPARDEEKNIAACIQSILRANYAGAKEIIVVDDHSSDNTAAIVKQFPDVQLINLAHHVSDPLNSYKKKAIEIGIAQSDSELIVCTDADCIVPQNWLQNIGQYYATTGFKFLAMPVKFFNKRNASFLNIFQGLDLMTYQGLSGAAIHANKPMLCNGANVAYSREAFDAVNGFRDIDHIASGDDVLLMHKIHATYPHGVHFLKSKEVIVETAAMPNWKDFFNQRIRWASKATQYKNKQVTFVAALVWLFNVLLLLIPILFFTPYHSFSFFGANVSWWKIWLIMISSKIIIELIYLYPVAKFFRNTKQLLWFIIAQPVHIIYTVIAGLLGLIGKYEWKGRRVK